MESLLNKLPDLIAMAMILGAVVTVFWKGMDGYLAMVKQMNTVIDRLQGDDPQSQMLKQNYQNAPESRKQIVRLALDGLDTLTDWTETTDDDDIPEKLRKVLGVSQDDTDATE